MTTQASTAGRVPVDAVLELIQPTRTGTLSVLRVPDHTNASYDPRTIHADRRVTLTGEQLAHFVPGPARIRVTANGRSQWLRVPPPVIREQAIEIGETGAANAQPRASAPAPAVPARRTTR